MTQVKSSTACGIGSELLVNGTFEKVPMLAQLLPGDHVFLGQQLFRVEING